MQRVRVWQVLRIQRGVQRFDRDAVRCVPCQGIQVATGGRLGGGSPPGVDRSVFKAGGRPGGMGWVIGRLLAHGALFGWWTGIDSCESASLRYL